MGFYDLDKSERVKLVAKINHKIKHDINNGEENHLIKYFSDSDTYIRKTSYLAIGKLYKINERLRQNILEVLKKLMTSDDEKIRQTTINSAGEIGMIDLKVVTHFFDTGLFDQHHSVRNAVIGSLKKMGAKNPKPALKWANNYLNHPDKEVRREICHGIELRGRTHPQDILPMLAKLQNDPTKRVKNTLIHVLGQIAYKKGCLETVIHALNGWKNTELIDNAIDEIVDVHERYKNFAALSQQEAITYISENYKNKKTS